MGGFSKTSYRSRRKKGLRGQGDKIKIEVKEEGKGHHMVQVARKLQYLNRKQARQKLRSRYHKPTYEVLDGFEDGDDGLPNPAKPIMRKVEDKVGRPYTRKGVKHIEGKPKRSGPLYDPTISNHERVFRQRIKSGRIKLNEGDK